MTPITICHLNWKHLPPPMGAMDAHLWGGGDTQLPCSLQAAGEGRNRGHLELPATVIKLPPVTSEHPVMLLQLMGWEEEER